MMMTSSSIDTSSAQKLGCRCQSRQMAEPNRVHFSTASLNHAIKQLIYYIGWLPSPRSRKLAGALQVGDWAFLTGHHMPEIHRAAPSPNRATSSGGRLGGQHLGNARRPGILMPEAACFDTATQVARSVLQDGPAHSNAYAAFIPPPAQLTGLGPPSNTATHHPLLRRSRTGS
jgi:hypothetical protein